MPFYTTSSISPEPPEPPGPEPGPDYPTMPITFEALDGASTIKLAQNGSPNSVNLSYKKKDGEWTAYTPNNSISLTGVGDFVSFSGSNTGFSKGFQGNYYNFQSTGNSQIVYGNIMSLVNWQTQVEANMFDVLFKQNTHIVDASNLILPANIAQQCYVWFMANCSNLTGAPYLRSPSLAAGCYWAMFEFSDIRKVRIAATNQGSDNTFEYSFQYNSNLSAVEVCFTQWGSNHLGWLGYVASSGLFIKPVDLYPNRGESNIPTNWTVLNRHSDNTLWYVNSINQEFGSRYIGDDPFADLLQ